MSFRDDITVLLITYNEEDNIERTLEAVKWAHRILIIDSGSTDTTIDTIERYPQAQVVTRAFDSFANQCNFGLSLVTTEWVLSLDADYELSAALIKEIDQLTPVQVISGWAVSFVYRVHGRPLRSSLYPPRAVLYRRERACYRDEGHGHRVVIDGTIGQLAAPIYHDDRKPLSRWLTSQLRYAKLEADKLLLEPPSSLNLSDRIRLMGWPAPILVFLYTLVFKGCLLDGWAGWLYVLQRTLAEIMIAIEIVDRRMRLSASFANLGSKPHK